MAALSKNKKAKLKLISKIEKVKEILPAHLKTKTKRLAHIHAVLAAPVTKEERRKEAQIVNKQCKQDVWNWTNTLDRAAFYIAEGRLSLAKVSEQSGVSVNKLKKMMALQGEFYDRVQHYRQQWEKKFIAQGYGNRLTRLQVLEELADKMVEIPRARQRKYFNRKTPGVDTGLMVRTVKAVGHGHNTKIVRGWDFDQALIREIRETMIHIAKERGDWAEKNINENTVLVREYDGASPDDV